MKPERVVPALVAKLDRKRTSKRVGDALIEGLNIAFAVCRGEIELPGHWPIAGRA